MWILSAANPAGVTLVDEHGAGHAKDMLPQFETYLENRGASDEEVYDRVREGVVVLLGTLARHMDADDAKVRLTGSSDEIPRIPLFSNIRLGMREDCGLSCTLTCCAILAHLNAHMPSDDPMWLWRVPL